jgi:CRISPR-associated protein Csb2
MPIDGFRKDGIQNTTMVFDTWAHVGAGEMLVRWDVSLDQSEAAVLEALALRLGYLGRSESWVEARFGADDVTDGRDEAFPCEGRQRPGNEWEQIAVLAPEPPAEYLSWRARSVESAQSATMLGAGKPQTKGKAKAKRDDAYPADLIACLEVDTGFLRRYGWGQPPGARSVLYWRRRDALEAGRPAAAPVPAMSRPVDLMVLSFATSSNNRHALPGVTRTLPQAELLHRAVVSRLASPDSCPALTGTSQGRRPLRGHRHAHVLPVDLDHDGHIDHVVLWAPMGFDGDAQAAVRAIRRTFMKGGVGELRVAVVGEGELANLRSAPAFDDAPLSHVSGPAKGARCWITETPFVPPRYLKSRGKNALQEQVRAELASRGIDSQVEIDIMDVRDPSCALFRHFVVHRRHGPLPPGRVGYGLRLIFTEPVQGPLCLGYASHFGLGRFRVTADTRPNV